MLARLIIVMPEQCCNQVRPLVCRGVYGAPGGDGLDSLARLLLSIADDEAAQRPLIVSVFSNLALQIADPRGLIGDQQGQVGIPGKACRPVGVAMIPCVSAPLRSEKHQMDDQ